MKLVKIGLVATALAAAVAFVGVGRPDFARGSAPAGRTVTVTGTGSVESVPNRAGLSVGVSSDAATARAALAASADKATSVIDALRAAGVDKADLQTTDVTVSPRWDDRGRHDASPRTARCRSRSRASRARARSSTPPSRPGRPRPRGPASTAPTAASSTATR